MNFPYFTLPKFPLLAAFINIFLLSFWFHKTCYKSFAIPMAYTGYDGCPSHHRFLQAKLIFPLDLSKKHQPLFSSQSPWNSHFIFFYSFPIFFSYSFFDFFTDIFSFSYSPSPETFRRIFLLLHILSPKNF